jgi:hypothetical protein
VPKVFNVFFVPPFSQTVEVDALKRSTVGNALVDRSHNMKMLRFIEFLTIETLGYPLPRRSKTAVWCADLPENRRDIFGKER